MKANHLTHQFPQLLLCMVMMPVVTGCSMFTDSLARSASEMATQNAVKAIREVDMDRQVDVTLIGGRTLNSGRGSLSRPVQTCIYVAQNPDWRPPPALGTADCVSRERDANVITSERRMVAPNQVQQFLIKAPGVREAWLVVDADFAQRPAEYVPLSLRIEGHGTIRVSAWLDGSAIFDGRQPLPQQAAPAPEPASAPPALVAEEQEAPTRTVRAPSSRAKNVHGLEGGSDRRLDLTLVGGRRLNAVHGGAPKPVQTCVYVVSNPDWRPPSSQVATNCANPERDDDVVSSECRPLAPNQLQQFQLRTPGTRELWVVVDADFAQRAANYTPLRLRMEGRGMIQMSAWLEGQGIFDGRQPLPPQAAADTEEPVPFVKESPPLRPLQPLPTVSPTQDPKPDSMGGHQ